DQVQHGDHQPEKAHGFHFSPPTCSSLPSTTPAATEIWAPPAAGNSARATPLRMRASTVLRPAESVCVKVTIVPSGTGLPVQSRMGSVSTTRPALLCWAMCMRRLQGSDATCCTTRRTDVSPSVATNCAAPAFRAEELLTQATPLRLVTLCDAPVPPTDKLNVTGTG